VNRNTAIKVSNLSKSFKLPHEKSSTIKSLVISPFKRRGYEKQEVLKNIDFDIKKGEFFGIVGRNGSGKSTLLKLLAGIYSPDKGLIQVNGKLTPFIELGVGFNPDLTGRENVFLNGALFGFSRKEMLGMYDEIVGFAELERFMDQKLKNYSSGMQVRLAFSIAIQVDNDILVLDEVLAVGDTDFQRKCFNYFVNLKKQKKTVVLVTHDMSAVENFCDRAMLIDSGRVVDVGPPRNIASQYDKLNSTNTSGDTLEGDRWGSQTVSVNSIDIFSDGKIQSKKSVSATQGKKLELTFTFNNNEKSHKDIVLGLAFYDKFGVNISGPNSKKIKANSSKSITYRVDKLPLNVGEYRVVVAVYDNDVIEEYDHLENALTLIVKSDSRDQHGKVTMFGDWGLK